MTPPLITALYAGLCGLLALVLAIRVSLHRSKERIDLGYEGNSDLFRTIRVHVNNIESTAIVLVILAIDEMLGAPTLAIHVMGAGFFVGRILHAQGLHKTSGPSLGRIAGQSLTWLALAVVSFYAVYLFAVGGRLSWWRSTR